MSSNYYPCLFALSVLPLKLSKLVTDTMVSSDSSVMRVVANLPLQPQKKVIDPTRELIERLLKERILLAGIAGAAQVAEQWLQTYVNKIICSCATKPAGDAQKKGRLTIQGDELWSCVNNKANKQWVWLALDADTREAAACQLWQSLPAVYPSVSGGIIPPETLDVNVPLPTLISGRYIVSCCPQSGTE